MKIFSAILALVFSATLAQAGEDDKQEDSPFFGVISLMSYSQDVILNHIVAYTHPFAQLDVYILHNKSGLYADLIKGTAFDANSSYADDIEPTLGWTGTVLKDYDADISVTYFNVKHILMSKGDFVEPRANISRRIDVSDSLWLRPFAETQTVAVLKGERLDGAFQAGAGLKVYYSKKWFQARATAEILYDDGWDAITGLHLTASLTRNLDLVGDVRIFGPMNDYGHASVVYGLGLSWNFGQ